MSYAAGATFQIAGDVTLYAQWAAKTNISLSFDANGGVGAPESRSVTYGTAVGALPGAGTGAPIREHHAFLGWSKSQAATAPDFNSSSIVDFDPGLTVYAVWKEDATFTVAYNANGGSGAPSDSNEYYGGDTVTVKSANMSRSGYTFEGWAETRGGAVKYNAGDTFKIADNTALFAVWRQNEPPEEPADPVTPPTPPTDPGTETPAVEPPAVQTPATDTGAPATVTNNAGSPSNTVADAPRAENTESVTRSPLALLSGGEIVSQDELRELARDAGIPLVGIGDNSVPLVGIEGYAFWSLIDLAIALAGIIFAVWHIFEFTRRRKQLDQVEQIEPDMSEKASQNRTLFTLALVATIANAALFLLSQDFTATPLVVLDVWSIPMAALFILECLFGRFAVKRAKAIVNDVNEKLGDVTNVWDVVK
jgi:uncharacterized repeat protein (TIGR02543 family)